MPSISQLNRTLNSIKKEEKLIDSELEAQKLRTARELREELGQRILLGVGKPPLKLTVWVKLDRWVNRMIARFKWDKDVL